MLRKIFFLFFLLILPAPQFCIAQTYDVDLTENVNNNTVNADQNANDSFDEYAASQGKVINKINIRIIDVSGPSVDETNGGDTSWIGGLVNALHFETREWVVRNSLLFSEGDTIDPIKLSESERLLRNGGYFLDARIRVENNNTSDSVIVNITTQDRWTLTFLVSYDPKNKNSYFGFRDDNFIGLGHKLDATLTHDEDKALGLGGIVKYSAVNVAGTFINIGADFEANNRFDKQTLSFNRPFLTTELDWAGGLNFIRENGDYNYFDPDGNFLSYPYNLSMQDLWIGRSFPFFFGSDIFQEKTRIVTSARISRLKHAERPLVTEHQNRIFQNTVLYLFSAGVINQRFYKDHYVDGFGVTEDIPVGGYFSITGGIEEREYNKRWYAGFESVYSRRIENIGYFSTGIVFSGFRNMNRWEQNIVDLNLLYHSPLLTEGKWKFRFLVNHDYLYGFNLFEGEQIYLDYENGLRGFDRFSLFGTKKIVLNTEAIIFSPYAPLGFVLGGVVFADLGLIAQKENRIIDSKLYQGYGAGLRINNESIAGASFEVSLIYNPNLASTSKSDLKILFTGKLIFGFRQFGFARPSIITINGVR